MGMGKVLVVEDKESMREVLVLALEQSGYDVLQSPDGADALAKLKLGSVDLVISDLKMPKMDGMELLRQSRTLHAPPAFIMVTAHGSIREAVEAKNLGAVDFLEKPFDLEELEFKVAEAIGSNAPIGSGVKLPKGVVGASAALHEAADILARVAESALPVLFVGDSGTGRTHIASTLHALSGRKGELHIASCAGDPSIEQRIFGGEQGKQKTTGLLEQCDDGTLLLQDIDALPLSAQARLARCLEQKSFERLGGSRAVELKARVLATTSKHLPALAAQQAFREDLMYRLNGVSIHLPILRDRREDLAPLIAHFLAAANQEAKKKVEFSPRAATLLREYQWPGNARELATVISRCVAMANGSMVSEGELPETVRLGRADALAGSLTTEVEAMERGRVLDALEKHGWNQTHAARALRLGRTSLQYKMQKYGLKRAGN